MRNFLTARSPSYFRLFLVSILLGPLIAWVFFISQLAIFFWGGIWFSLSLGLCPFSVCDRNTNCSGRVRGCHWDTPS